MEPNFDFDSGLEPLEKSVKYKGKNYIVVEADESSASAWRNFNISAAKLKDGELAGFGKIADGTALLVSKCLFEIKPDGTRASIPQEQLTLWPSRIIRPLFDWIKKVSELGEEDTIESLKKRIAEDTKKLAKLETKESVAKNEQSATEATSV